MLSFSISYSNSINVLYFADSISLIEGIGGGEREGEDRVTLGITLGEDRVNLGITLGEDRVTLGITLFAVVFVCC
jgi:hypothetical protein